MPSLMRDESVIGLPSRSIIQSAGRSSPRWAAERTLPKDDTVVAMSITTGGPSAAGMAAAIGLVPSSRSALPHGAM